MQTSHFVELHDWATVDKIKPDVAFITNPTNLHIETATECAERGMHLFIEKPLDCKIDYGLHHLLNVVNVNKITAYVAYPLRFHPIVKKLKEENHSSLTFVCDTNLAKWRDYKTYSAYKAQGGGALLELSHEIDLARYLLGPIEKITGKVGREENDLTDAETVATLTTHHANGKRGNIILDLLSHREQRFIVTGRGKRFDLNEYASVVKGCDGIFQEQLKYFFDNLNHPGLMNNIVDASETFRKIIEFREGN
jgi:predicted dehydrogenase